MSDGLHDDARLAQVLASIGGRLDVGPSARDDTGVASVTGVADVFDLVELDGGGGEVEWRYRWMRPATAAAIVVGVVAASMIVTPVRQTVAGWLGVGSTRIETTPTMSDLDRLAFIADEVEPIDVEAARRLGVELDASAATPLGAHDWAGTVAEGGVLLGWDEGATTLWIRSAAAGIDAADLGLPLLKQVSPGSEVVSVPELGAEAVLLTGDHVLQTPQRRLAAGTVLLWVAGDTEYRLESDLVAEVMIEQARAASALSGG